MQYSPERLRQLSMLGQYGQGLGAIPLEQMQQAGGGEVAPQPATSAPVTAVAPQPSAPQPSIPAAAAPATPPKENWFSKKLRGLGETILPTAQARALGIADADIPKAQEAARRQLGLGMLMSSLQGGDPYQFLSANMQNMRMVAQERSIKSSQAMDPADVRSFEYGERLRSQDPEAFKRWEAARRSQNLPTSFAEVDRMTSDPKYLDSLRQIVAAKIGAPYTQTEQAGAQGAFSRTTGGFKPATTLEQEAGGKQRLAEAAALGSQTGKSTAEAAAAAPAAIADAQKMRDGILGLITDPGFDVIYGKSRYVSPSMLPGQRGADAEARRVQLEAQAFGISIQKMRGLGQLSEGEGKKMSAAYTRATNPNISSEAARAAWNEVLGYLDIAEAKAKADQERANAEAKPTTPATPPKVRKYNPVTGKIE